MKVQPVFKEIDDLFGDDDFEDDQGDDWEDCDETPNFRYHKKCGEFVLKEQIPSHKCVDLV